MPNISTKINLLKLLLADKENFKKVMIFTETKKNADRIVERLADHWKGELSVIPVSYTHLDVYKRQVVVSVCE